jgi:hypothetical protein
MSGRPTKDLPASVSRRLLNRAREQDLAFQDLCQRFAMERFLYRLSASSHGERFILKGALMLFVWSPDPSRQTMDIDLLGQLPNDTALLRMVFRDVCRLEVPADGMVFDAETLEMEQIAREAPYPGVRVNLRARLGNTRLLIRVDVGFGDRVVPAPEVVDYPTLLEFPAPRLRAYSRETAIAEKFHAMVHLGEVNSRLKDFFDIWSLSRSFNFEGARLARAIHATFEQRERAMPARTLALTAEFGEMPSKQVQWASFVRKRGVQGPSEFGEVVAQVASFLQPVASALSEGAAFEGRWAAPGPWDLR